MFTAANELERLAGLYGGTDKLEHGYLPHYERHLGSARWRQLTVYEIGVGGWGSDQPGGSLRVWRDYFPRSTVVGLDIDQKSFEFGKRVKFERVDQSSEIDLTRAVKNHGRPDIVIDDGSHIGRHIWASFECLWPLLPAGGTYVIEDLSTSYYPDWEGGNPPPKDSGVALAQELVDSVQALDSTFASRPDYGHRDPARFPDVAAVHAYPGIVFITKALTSAG